MKHGLFLCSSDLHQHLDLASEFFVLSGQQVNFFLQLQICLSPTTTTATVADRLLMLMLNANRRDTMSHTRTHARTHAHEQR